MQVWGKILVFIGTLLILTGLVLWLFGDKLHGVGRLPGDIRIERPNFQFYFPITTLLLISLLLSLLLTVFARWFR